MKVLDLQIVERLSLDQPIRFRKRMVRVDCDSVTIGSIDGSDVQLHPIKRSFSFEIKWSEDAWWIVNPNRDASIRLNGQSVHLNASLKNLDEIEIFGHKIKLAAAPSVLRAVVDFKFSPQNDLDLWNHLIDENSFDEIMINGPNKVFIEKSGMIHETPWSFSEKGFLDAIVYNATGKTSGWAQWRQNGNLRLHAVLAPAVENTHITIRRARSKSFSLDELERLKFGTQSQIDYLKLLIKERKNIIISGGTSSGKTSLLRALVQEMQLTDRILILEEEREVEWPHPHVVSIETGRGHLAKAVVESLRMRPTRLIVGEVRGEESFEMLQAMNTGHDGSMTTVHANSPREALHRIESLALCSEISMSAMSLRRQIVQAVHAIVQLRRDDKGLRFIDSIVEISGIENEIILLSDSVGDKRIGLQQEELR